MGDIDWSVNALHVRRQLQPKTVRGKVFSPPKTKAGKRIVQLGPETMRLLAKHRNNQDAERLTDDWTENNMVFPSTAGTPTG